MEASVGRLALENEFLLKIGIRRCTGTLRILTFILLRFVSPREILSQILQEKERVLLPTLLYIQIIYDRIIERASRYSF